MSAADKSLTDLRDAIAAGGMSAEEAVGAALERVERLNPALNAFLETFPDRALEQARAVDERIASGGAATVGPLAGVPVAVKDNMCLEYGRTTCASRILEQYHSPFTGTAPRRLIDAGAIIVGKTNLDEFAMGSSNEHSAFGPARNPWDSQRSPGGSSGGSTAAVAARIVPGALGSDTGGSIRQPASLCGVVGLKPTYGRVSRWGLVAFASSFDQIGPLTCTVRDAALLLGVIAGHDPLDSTSAREPAPADYLAKLDVPIDGLRLGVPSQARSERNHPAVGEALDAAIEKFTSLGAEIVDIELPSVDQGIAAYYIITPAEASSNLARYDGVRYGRRAKMEPGEDLIALYSRSRAEGFGPEVQRRIMLGTYALSAGYYDAYYKTALKARRVIKNDFDAAFSAAAGGPGVHAVLMPSAPGPAFKIGAKTDDPLSMYLEDYYTVPANLAGLPAISMPGGFADEDGRRLPVGVQLVAPAFDEATLLRAARMYEAAAGDLFSASPPVDQLAGV